MVHPVIDHMVARSQGDGFEPVMVESMLRVLADGIGKFIQHCSAKIRDFSVTRFGFLGHASSSGQMDKSRKQMLSLDASTGRNHQCSSICVAACNRS